MPRDWILCKTGNHIKIVNICNVLQVKIGAGVITAAWR